jgi:hypothetical protein
MKFDGYRALAFIGSKVPPGNDKVPEDTTPEAEAWFQERIKE